MHISPSHIPILSEPLCQVHLNTTKSGSPFKMSTGTRTSNPSAADSYLHSNDGRTGGLSRVPSSLPLMSEAPPTPEPDEISVHGFSSSEDATSQGYKSGRLVFPDYNAYEQQYKPSDLCGLSSLSTPATSIVVNSPHLTESGCTDNSTNKPLDTGFWAPFAIFATTTPLVTILVCLTTKQIGGLI